MTKPDPAPITNRHPADEAAEVKAQLKPLLERYRVLRLQLLEMPAKERRGADWYADVTSHTSVRWDRKPMEREFGLERLRKFMREKSYQRVDLVKNRNKNA
jgi:hypothetical protein